MKILNKATRSAHKAILRNPKEVQPYSRYPVWEVDFWRDIFESAQNPNLASKVLEEMKVLEDEPCVENERVWRNISVAKSMAKVTLAN
jgi:hypothetical protein